VHLVGFIIRNINSQFITLAMNIRYWTKFCSSLCYRIGKYQAIPYMIGEDIAPRILHLCIRWESVVRNTAQSKIFLWYILTIHCKIIKRQAIYVYT